MFKSRIAPLIVLAALAPQAWAIQVEPDQPDLKNPKTQLVESGRAAETLINGGTTSISQSSFTGFNDTVKRKAFPPGYGRSGYQFEDELTGADTTPRTAAKPGAEASEAQTAPPETRKP